MPHASSRVRDCLDHLATGGAARISRRVSSVPRGRVHERRPASARRDIVRWREQFVRLMFEVRSARERPSGAGLFACGESDALGGVVNSARVCGWSDWVFDEVQFHAEFHSVCGASSIGPNEIRCEALVHAPPPEKILHLGRARARATAHAPLTSSHSVVDAHSPNGPKTNPARYAGGMRPRRRACWRAAVAAAPESCRLRLRAQLLDFALGRRTDVLFAFGTIDSVILKQR